MQILDNMVKELRGKPGIKQCTNTMEVINRLNFVIFNIEGFYPAITPKLVNRTPEWAMA